MINNNDPCSQKQQLILEPPLYFTEEHVWNVCFHPNANVIACSEITGVIQVLGYSSEDVKPLVQNRQLHKSSARYCTFNPAGNLLASCGQDKRLGFLDGNGKVAHIIKKAHPEPIHRCKFLNNQTIASGDDNGLIKLWDLRTVAPVFEASDQTQAISGITFCPEISQFLIYTSSLNGSVACYDLRMNSDSISKLICLSDSTDQELLDIATIKNGKYIACSSSQGSVLIYKRDQMQNFVDRIQGLSGSVSALLKIDENTIVTGSEDGFVRGLSVYPNKILRVLGQHEQQQNYEIQSLSLSHCKNFLASSSHDNSIKFYDVHDFIKDRLKKSQSNEEEQVNEEQMMSEEANIKQQNQIGQQNSEDYEDQDDSDSDSEQQQMEQKYKKNKKKKRTNMKARQKQIKRQNIKSFFKGL